MLHASCLTLRWYVPAATRREYVPVGSLMSSLTSNGRIRGVPTQRRKLRVADGFTSSRCGVIGGAGGQGCADRRFSGMKTASLQGCTCSVSACPAPQHDLAGVRSRDVPTRRLVHICEEIRSRRREGCK